MKIKITLLFILLTKYMFCQDFGQMYWQMRQRLLDKFLRVGNCHGCSIPASWLKVKESGSDELHFQDESLRHIGWYVAVLATEHRLLELQWQSTLAQYTL